MTDKKRKRNRPILLHISVTEEIANDLKRIAKQQGRTVTELAREAFARLIRDYEIERIVRERMEKLSTDRQ